VDANDRRARRLGLSERGRQRLRAAHPHGQRAQSRFELSYGATDAQALRGMLHRVVESTAG
jgi:hypothetical protein